MTLGWPEAVARLAGARTQAVTLAGLLKKHGNEAQRDRGALLYTEAKAESDAVLAGLLVALDQRRGPAALPDLEARLRRAVEGVKALADHIGPLLPDQAGQKAGVGDLLANTVEALLAPLVEAVSTLWQARREDDALERATIRAQLEGTRWPDFVAIAAAP
jgi:hypothetical protein